MYQEAGLSRTQCIWVVTKCLAVCDRLPKCQELMKEKGMTKADRFSEYFITQMADVMQKNGLKFSGWQEVALGHTEEAHQQLRARLRCILLEYCTGL